MIEEEEKKIKKIQDAIQDAVATPPSTSTVKELEQFQKLGYKLGYKRLDKLNVLKGNCKINNKDKVL